MLRGACGRAVGFSLVYDQISTRGITRKFLVRKGRLELPWPHGHEIRRLLHRSVGAGQRNEPDAVRPATRPNDPQNRRQLREIRSGREERLR